MPAISVPCRCWTEQADAFLHLYREERQANVVLVLSLLLDLSDAYHVLRAYVLCECTPVVVFSTP